MAKQVLDKKWREGTARISLQRGAKDGSEEDEKEPRVSWGAEERRQMQEIKKWPGLEKQSRHCGLKVGGEGGGALVDVTSAQVQLWMRLSQIPSCSETQINSRSGRKLKMHLVKKM